MWGQKYDTIAKVSTHLLKKIFQVWQGFQRFRPPFQIYVCHASVIAKSVFCHFSVKEPSNFIKISLADSTTYFTEMKSAFAECFFILNLSSALKPITQIIFWLLSSTQTFSFSCIGTFCSIKYLLTFFFFASVPKG